ncbi:MAG: hypothetical protein FJX67_13980 [Alphaproteobacteria bacterium]|nr:hypothetical protein [Alphaproteobacteria bacterium]
MRYVCDAPAGRTWFQIETEVEAARESEEMRHAVEKFFLRERDRARQTYRPTSPIYIEQEIGLKAHLARDMAMFLTLRNQDGEPLSTAMLPRGGHEDRAFRIILVGPGNQDPYPKHGDAIEALGRHFGLVLDRERCFPYDRGRD